MTLPVDLLAELRSLLGTASTSYSSASQTCDLYEGFLFALVVSTARDRGARVTFEDVHGRPTTDLIFRTSPGRLSSKRRDYTHAVLAFGTAPPVEVHVGVKVQGNSGVEHECDVLVLDAAEAQVCRQIGASPHSRRSLLAIECKFYTSSLPLHQARGFAGLKTDLGQTDAIFVANTNSASAVKFLNHKRNLTQEFDALPASTQIAPLRSHIREAFKKHVLKYDPRFPI